MCVLQWIIYRGDVPCHNFPISFKKIAYGSILSYNTSPHNASLVVEELDNNRMIIGENGGNPRTRYWVYSLIYGE